MSAIESILNATIFELMGFLQAGPDEELQAVTFWFYSEEEGDIYRLAYRLTDRNYKVWVSYCKVDDTWQCIAELTPVPPPNQLEQIRLSMSDLAGTLGVQYEGWLNCGCLELNADK